MGLFGKSPNEKLGILAAAEAAKAGFSSKVSFDEDSMVLTFEGLGTKDVTRAFKRALELEGAKRENYVRGTVKVFLGEAQRSLPERYSRLPADLHDAVFQHLENMAKFPESPVFHEGMARVDRAYGLSGWEQKLTFCARQYRHEFDQHEYTSSGLNAANLFRLSGDQATAVELADRVLGLLSTRSWDDDSINPWLGEMCAAHLIKGDVGSLAALRTVGPTQHGPRWWMASTAADALLRRDARALSAQIEAARVLADVPLDESADNPSQHDVLEILSEWEARLA